MCYDLLGTVESTSEAEAVGLFGGLIFDPLSLRIAVRCVLPAHFSEIGPLTQWRHFNYSFTP